MTIHHDLVLVIGLGNTLRGDDALGRVAAGRLRDVVAPQVRIIDQCAPTPELAAEIAESSLVIFLDASADGPEERVVTHELAAASRLEAMAHRLDAGALLALTNRLYQHSPQAFAVTFRGRSFEMSDCQLSPESARACDQIVEETERLIAAHREQSRDY